MRLAGLNFRIKPKRTFKSVAMATRIMHTGYIIVDVKSIENKWITISRWGKKSTLWVSLLCGYIAGLIHNTLWISITACVRVMMPYYERSNYIFDGHPSTLVVLKSKRTNGRCNSTQSEMISRTRLNNNLNK